MTIRHGVVGAAIAALFAGACGGDGDEKKLSAATATAAVDDGSAKGPKAAPVAAVKASALSGVSSIVGEAVLASEAGAGAKGPIELVLGEGGRLAGSLSLGASKCALSGMVEDAVARAWIDCAAAEGATAKRGALVGESAAGKYAGSFAVSDDGAANVVRGTWTAGR